MNAMSFGVALGLLTVLLDLSAPPAAAAGRRRAT